MTLIQGDGVDCPGPRIVTYSFPPSANPPSPLKNSSWGARSGTGRWGALWDLFERTDGLDRVGDAIELVGKASLLRHQHNTGGGDKKRTRLGGDQVRPKNEDPA